MCAPSSCPVSLLPLPLKYLLVVSSGFFTPPLNLAKQQYKAELLLLRRLSVMVSGFMRIVVIDYYQIQGV